MATPTTSSSYRSLCTHSAIRAGIAFLMSCSAAVVSAQTISKITVNPAVSPATVTIAGSGFAATNVVSLSGITLVKSSTSSTAIVAILPSPIAAGDYLLQVKGSKTATWNFTYGAVGPQGVQGPPGMQGAQGVQGAAGVIGATGPAGPQGNQGPAGAQGPAGPQGEPGLAGTQGPQGNQGLAGPQGPQGIEGATGATGATGPTGLPGLKGDTGAQGIQGPAGPAGLQGPAGPQGEQGPLGLMGVTGAQGPQGPEGPAGPQGPAGPAGGIQSAYVIDSSVMPFDGTTLPRIQGGGYLYFGRVPYNGPIYLEDSTQQYQFMNVPENTFYGNVHSISGIITNPSTNLQLMCWRDPRVAPAFPCGKLTLVPIQSLINLGGQ